MDGDEIKSIIKEELNQIPKKGKGSGYKCIKNPDDLCKCLQKMMNKVMMSSDCETRGGQFAMLSNAWVAAQKLKADQEDLKQINRRLKAIEAQQKVKK